MANSTDGKRSGADQRAPWREKMNDLRAAFPSPWREEGEDQVFERTFMQAVALLDGMKHSRSYQAQKAWQGYLGGPALPDYSDCPDARLQEEMQPLAGVIEELLGRPDEEAPAPTEPAAMDVERWFGDNDHIPREYLVPPPRVPALDTLRQIPFCAHLDRGQLQQLVNDSETVTCEADAVLFCEGDRADRCYIILAGAVRVYRLGADGEEDEITVLRQGQFFGEQALFDQGLRSATVRCIEPCELLIIDGQRFFASVVGS